MPARDDLDTFHIAFDTLAMPGKMLVTTVTIKEEIYDITDEMNKGEGFQKMFHVSLADHPFYMRLVRYISDNPPPTLKVMKVRRRPPPE